MESILTGINHLNVFANVIPDSCIKPTTYLLILCNKNYNKVNLNFFNYYQVQIQ